MKKSLSTAGERRGRTLFSTWLWLLPCITAAGIPWRCVLLAACAPALRVPKRLPPQPAPHALLPRPATRGSARRSHAWLPSRCRSWPARRRAPASCRGLRPRRPARRWYREAAAVGSGRGRSGAERRRPGRSSAASGPTGERDGGAHEREAARGMGGWSYIYWTSGETNESDSRYKFINSWNMVFLCKKRLRMLKQQIRNKVSDIS